MKSSPFEYNRCVKYNGRGECAIPTFVTQSLEEIRFWSRIMKEHAFFLSLGFNANDTELIQEAKTIYCSI